MRRTLTTTALTVFLLSCSATLFAQDNSAETPTRPEPVCVNSPGFADFDFWVGEWNVFSNDEARKLQGTNSITKHYNSCLLKEDWKGSQGGGGFSINYYNSVRDEWRQVWVSDGYSIDYTGGRNSTGDMELTGLIYNYRQNTASPFRGIWTPQVDGTVIQHFDVFDESEAGWKVWFEGLYVKKEPRGDEN